MRRREIARELGVSVRTITNMVQRGEVERVELDGVVWFRSFPGKGQESNVSHLDERMNTGDENGRERANTFPRNWENNQERAHLVDELEQARAALDEQRERADELQQQIGELRIELVRAETSLVHMTQERDALRRVVEQRVGLLGWLKRLAEWFTSR